MVRTHSTAGSPHTFGSSDDTGSSGGSSLGRFGQSVTDGLGSGVGMAAGSALGDHLLGGDQDSSSEDSSSGQGSGAEDSGDGSYGYPDQDPDSDSSDDSDTDNGDDSGDESDADSGADPGADEGSSSDDGSSDEDSTDPSGYSYPSDSTGNSTDTGDSGSSSGGGPNGDSIYGTHDSLVGKIEQAVEQLGQNLIGGASSSGLSELVSFAEDPVGTLLSAGLSFLMQVVQLVVEPLQQLEADPGAVRDSAQQYHDQASGLRQLAQDHAQDAGSLGEDWQGDTADRYRQVASQTSGQLASFGRVLEGAGNVTTSAGGLVSGLRSLVIKAVSELIERLIPGGVSALAAAPETFGASLAIFLADALGVAAKLATDIISKIRSLKDALSEVDNAFDQLGSLAEQLAGGMFGPEGGSSGSGGSAATAGAA